MSNKILAMVLAMLCAIQTLALAQEQEVQASESSTSTTSEPVRFSPVRPSSPLLVASGGLLAAGGSLVLVQTYGLKTEYDEAWATWDAARNAFNESQRDQAAQAFYGTFGLGLGMVLGGAVLMVLGVNHGEGDNDWFLVPPPQPAALEDKPSQDVEPLPDVGSSSSGLRSVSLEFGLASIGLVIRL